MTKPKTVSQAYLLGLADERALLRQMIAQGDNLAIEAPAMLASAQATRGKGFSGDMAEYMRASVDFWALQVRKLGRAAA